MANEKIQANDDWRPWVPRWLPNAISVVRVLLVPVWGVTAEFCRDAFVAGDATSTDSWRAWTFAILVTIGVSDIVDGYLARRFGLTSRMGATLDAFADKLAQVALLLFFTVRGAPAFPDMPAWFLALVLLRDVFLGVGWLIMRKKLGSVRVVHRFHGKLSSVLFFALLVLLCLDAARGWIDPLMYAITALILASTIAYARDGLVQLRAHTMR